MFTDIIVELDDVDPLKVIAGVKTSPQQALVLLVVQVDTADDWPTLYWKFEVLTLIA